MPRRGLAGLWDPSCLQTSPSLPRGLTAPRSCLHPAPTPGRWRAKPGPLGPSVLCPQTRQHRPPPHLLVKHILTGGGTGLVLQLNQKGVGGDTSTEWPFTACWGDRWRGRSSGQAPRGRQILRRAPSALWGAALRTWAPRAGAARPGPTSICTWVLTGLQSLPHLHAGQETEAQGGGSDLPRVTQRSPLALYRLPGPLTATSLLLHTALGYPQGTASPYPGGPGAEDSVFPHPLRAASASETGEVYLRSHREPGARPESR